jgi:hypothetical protein
MQSTIFLNKFKDYIITLIDKLSKEDPLISIMSPIINRVINKNYKKINHLLDYITDENGEIDAENILTEMIEKLLNTKPFTFNTSFIGDIEIGGGALKLNVPFTNKKLIIDIADLETFKQTLTTN